MPLPAYPLRPEISIIVRASRRKEAQARKSALTCVFGGAAGNRTRFSTWANAF